MTFWNSQITISDSLLILLPNICPSCRNFFPTRVGPHFSAAFHSNMYWTYWPLQIFGATRRHPNWRHSQRQSKFELIWFSRFVGHHMYCRWGIPCSRWCRSPGKINLNLIRIRPSQLKRMPRQVQQLVYLLIAVHMGLGGQNSPFAPMYE